MNGVLEVNKFTEEKSRMNALDCATHLKN